MDTFSQLSSASQLWCLSLPLVSVRVCFSSSEPTVSHRLLGYFGSRKRALSHGSGALAIAGFAPAVECIAPALAAERQRGMRAIPGSWTQLLETGRHLATSVEAVHVIMTKACSKWRRVQHHGYLRGHYSSISLVHTGGQLFFRKTRAHSTHFQVRLALTPPKSARETDKTMRGNNTTTRRRQTDTTNNNKQGIHNCAKVCQTENHNMEENSSVINGELRPLNRWRDRHPNPTRHFPTHQAGSIRLQCNSPETGLHNSSSSG